MAEEGAHEQLTVTVGRWYCSQKLWDTLPDIIVSHTMLPPSDHAVVLYLQSQTSTRGSLGINVLSKWKDASLEKNVT
jgi:hypothetical protein